MNRCLIIFAAAAVLDYRIGDPCYALHPVRLFGKLIGGVERLFFRIGWNGLIGGFAAALVFPGIVAGVFFILCALLSRIHPFCLGFLYVFAIFSCIAYRDLVSHAETVVKSISQNDLSRARINVSRIVGRDVSALDFHGIGRAAVETIAENFVDGFLSPVFWYCAGCFAGNCFGTDRPFAGCLAMLIYRAVNTMDSMTGYKNDRYLFFGRAGARLDDVMNFIPARLSVAVFTAAAYCAGMNAPQCLRAAMRDRLKHASPNSGHPESCVAGALGLMLGGPAVYHGRAVEKPWIGSGRKEVNEEDIGKALILNKTAFFITLIAVLMFFSVT